MEVIPAIDVRDGRCVQLVAGRPDTAQDYGDPIDALERWQSAGASRVHVVDLDAAMHRGDNRRVIERLLAAAEVPIQVGGGLRSLEDVRSLLAAGADRVILGTAAVTEPAVVRGILDAVDRRSVLVALETVDGGLAVEGWSGSVDADLLEVAHHFDRHDVGGILFTNVEREGQLDGIDPMPIERLTSTVSVPVYASGGVASLDDVTAAQAAGAAGLVVGTALYAGRFSLRAAMELTP